MKSFKLDENYQVVCEWKKTRVAFKHVATILSSGRDVYETKICYQNRTWESYEFQSVVHKAIEGYFKGDVVKVYKAAADGKPQDEGPLKTVALVAAIGEVMCKTTEEKNIWKKRMLGTVPGIDFPADFDNLSEAEKERRLNGAIKQAKGDPK